MGFIHPNTYVKLDHAHNRYPQGFHPGAPTLTDVESQLVPPSIRLGNMIFGVAGITVQWVWDEQQGLTIVAPGITISDTNLIAGDGGQLDGQTLGITTPSIGVAETNLDAGDGGQTKDYTMPVPVPSIAVQAELV
jgi:hypothetical protein